MADQVMSQDESQCYTHDSEVPLSAVYYTSTRGGKEFLVIQQECGMLSSVHRIKMFQFCCRKVAASSQWRATAHGLPAQH